MIRPLRRVRWLWGLWCLGLLACEAGAGYVVPEVNLPEYRACRGLPPLDASPIEVRGAGFTLEGNPVVPHGVGSYPLLQLMGEGRLADVRDIFEQARQLGRPLLRTGAFLEGGSNPARTRHTDGSVREAGLEALDLLLAEAADAQVRLLLILTNNWSDYGGAPFLVESLVSSEAPKDVFWTDPRTREAYQDFVRALVGRRNRHSGVRYAEDPTVFAWELANEARCSDPRYCAGDTLVEWARVMAESVRDAGAQQPIAWGGAGYLGRHGEDLRALAEDGAVDILTMHIYPQLADRRLSLLTGQARIDASVAEGVLRIQEGARISRRYRVPLLIEELGHRPAEGPGRDAERAAVFHGWLAAAHAEGLATLPWMIGETGRPDYDGFLIRSEDVETWQVLRCE